MSFPRIAATTTLVFALMCAVTAAANGATNASARPDGVRPAEPKGPKTIFPLDNFGPRANDNVALKWSEQTLASIRAASPAPTVVSRVLAIVQTSVYDAWAAYDPVAKVTRPDGPAQQQASLNTLTNKKVAISYAAYRALIDLFPPGLFPPKGGYKDPDVFLREVLGYPTTQPIDGTLADPNATAATPAGVGNLAAKAVLDYRRGKLPRVDGPNKYGDGSNQVGDDPNGTLEARYSDTTGYQPANKWNLVNNRWRWQPLCVLTPTGIANNAPPVRDPSPGNECPDTPPVTTPPTPPNYALQKALTPQWGKVVPFSLAASQYRVTGPPKNPDGSCCSTTDIVTAVKDTSNLSDSSKSRAEYWADGPGSVFPPGHSAVFAQALSRKKGNNLDTDAKLFFLVGNAMMDASIASWYQKFFGAWLGTTNKYDFVRPVTAIREYYKAQGIAKIPGSWKGPNQGFGDVDADKWLPYQAYNVVTPAFPEYVSGHSTFTAAGATMLAQFNGGDTFGASVIIKAGTSQIEKGGLVPQADVTLTWPTFSDASNDAGMSRRWGGIHFYTGDMHGRALGRQVAQYVWGTGQNYIKGYTGK
jgi:hypothetical protein